MLHTSFHTTVPEWEHGEGRVGWGVYGGWSVSACWIPKLLHSGEEGHRFDVN